jgi:hypothetical protein
LETEADAALEPTEDMMGPINLDYSGLAQDVTLETVPAQSESPDAPYWAYGPEYTVITLQGYPVTNHFFQPQIFIYPVAEMTASNEGMGTMAADLQALLGTQNPGETMPYLPLYNAAQVFHTQVQFLDFSNGRGVRFLTQFSQGLVLINNNDLIYTFQGLTNDGRYYIAAVLPITQQDLPADTSGIEEWPEDVQGYLATTAATLDQQLADSFSPDLNALDALIRSIEVK